jgi:polar amino acid transport system substrate-binding protein
MKFAYLIEPPFNDRTPDGRVVGCDVELAEWVFRALGADGFEPLETEFAELLPGVAEGRWRMTTGLFATEERRRTAAFSRPVWALPDGLLVPRGNPAGLSGYASVAERESCVFAVVRDQFQHRTAVAFGVPEDRILIFETYGEAAAAVEDGRAGAYASVGRAHAGYLARSPERALELVTVPASEKPPAFGCFAMARHDLEFRTAVDAALGEILGTPEHREMMARYGFSEAEVDLVVQG